MSVWASVIAIVGGLACGEGDDLEAVRCEVRLALGVLAAALRLEAGALSVLVMSSGPIVGCSSV